MPLPTGDTDDDAVSGDADADASADAAKENDAETVPPPTTPTHRHGINALEQAIPPTFIATTPFLVAATLLWNCGRRQIEVAATFRSSRGLFALELNAPTNISRPPFIFRCELCANSALEATGADKLKSRPRVLVSNRFFAFGSHQTVPQNDRCEKG